LALVAGTGVEFAVDGFVGFGVGVDEGAEKFRVLVGEIPAERDTAVDGLQVEGLAFVRRFLVWLGAVGVEDVADPAAGAAELGGGVGGGQVDQLLFGDLEVLGRHGRGDLVQDGRRSPQPERG
jgi:hypothetical protein